MVTPRTSTVSIQVNYLSLHNYDNVIDILIIWKELLQHKNNMGSNIISIIYYVILSNLFKLYESQLFHKRNNNLLFRVDFMVC